MKEHILKTLILGSSFLVFASSLYAVKPKLPKSKPLDFSPPQGSRHLLENGMVIYILKDNTLPIINISAKIKTGKLNEIMARHTGQTLKQIERDLERDNFMSGAQAVEYGLIDTVLAQRTEMSTKDEADS